MDDLVKWLRQEGREREDSCIQEMDYCTRMRRAADEIERLTGLVARARPLVSLLTVRQVIESNDEAICASGLNPWCMNEGLANGDESIGAWWLS